MDPVFLVAGQTPVPDMLGWAEEHPGALAPGLETVATALPLPDGREVPFLGVFPDGHVVVVDAVVGDEEETLRRLAGTVGLLRRQASWLQRLFPRKNLQGFDAPRLIVLAPFFSPGFAEALGGLAAAEVALVRMRTVEGADGARLLLVEREGPAAPGPEAAREYPDLSEEEERFFAGVETEREAVARQGTG